MIIFYARMGGGFMTLIMRVLLCFLILIAHIGYGSQSVEVVEELTVEQTGTITIPQVAEGYEDDYRLFLSGKLIYKPNPDSDVGKIEMRIVDLTNPLGSEFDLSACGDIGNHLRISTGYRKSKIEHQDKLEIWFSPLFLIERELETTAAHFHEVIGELKSREWYKEENVGFFWNRSDQDLECYNYATRTFYEISEKNYNNHKYNNLYDNTSRSSCHGPLLKMNSYCKHLEKFRLAFEIWPEKPDIVAVLPTMERSSEIPEIARGYEEDYRMFLSGRLVYKPNRTGDTGQIELAIADLPNPLDGEFDLNTCGDMWKYVSINTGYRKGKQAKNRFKTEVWFVPRFVVERELNSTASHLRPIMDKWPARFPVGIFCTWGNWDSSKYAYLVTQTLEGLSDGTLSNHTNTSLTQGNFSWYVNGSRLDTRLCSFCIHLASENSLRIRNRGESVIRQACARDFQAVASSSFSPSYLQEQWTETTPNGVCIIGKTYTSSGPDFPGYQQNYLYGTRDTSNPGYIQYCPSGKRIICERFSKLYWEQIILPALEADARKFDFLSLSEFPWKWEQDGEGYHYSGWGYW